MRPNQSFFILSRLLCSDFTHAARALKLLRVNSSNKIKLDLLAVWVHDVGSELVSFDHLCLNSLTNPIVFDFGPSKWIEHCFHDSAQQFVFITDPHKLS